jgi:hypothetical protein
MQHSLNLLSDLRFESSREEVLQFIIDNRAKEDFDHQLADQVLAEDDRLEIKHKTFVKCRLKLLFAIPILAIAILLRNLSNLFLILAVFSAFIIISSFFGLATNRINKLQKKYLFGE